MILAQLDYFKCITSVHSPGHQWRTSEHLTMGFWASFPDHNGICVVLPFNGSEFWQRLDTRFVQLEHCPLRFLAPSKASLFSLLIILESDAQNLAIEGIGHQLYSGKNTRHWCQSISVWGRVHSAPALQPNQINDCFQFPQTKMRKIKWACGHCICVTMSLGAGAAFTSSPAFRSSTSTLRRGSWALQQETQLFSPENVRTSCECRNILIVYKPKPVYNGSVTPFVPERKMGKTAPQECDRDQHREYPSKHRDQKRQCHGWRMIQNPR